METTTIALRVLHIGCGVFWAGAAMMLVGFVEPTVRRMGPEGGRFMQHLMGASRFPKAMALAGAVTVLSGLALFWSSSGGVSAAWLQSGHGLAITFGSLAGIGAFLVGALVNGPTAARLGALAARLETSSGPPPHEIRATFARLQQRLRDGGRRATLLITASVAAMAVSRYLVW